jgi:tetratricopeptide (TPR) repeat protein
MLDWTPKTLRAPMAGLVGSLAMMLAFPAAGQAPQAPQPAQFDPSDVYFQGYLATRSAEQLEAAGDFIGALEKLEKAGKCFDAVRKYYPEWKPEMVGGRSEKTLETLGKVRPKAEEQFRKNRNMVAELEGGEQKSGELIDPAKGVEPLHPGILEVNPLAARQLNEAESEVERLRKLSATGDLKRQNDFLKAQLRAAEANVQALRARFAKAPISQEMEALNKRIGTLEQEREAMAMALTQSRSAHTEALAKIATLQADLEVTRQRYANIDRDLKSERKFSNEVVAGLRKQLEAADKELAAKNTELAKAHERIAGLMDELQETRDSFTELRTERDSLLQERDQMSALLKLNEASRIQELIEQNMSLAKNLREANERVDRLNLASNSDKEAINLAKRDLAIAKARINRLHQDKREQDKRLVELENRLNNEEKELTSGKLNVDPAEAEALREIIKRQRRVMERQRQARELLVDAAKELGTKDENLAKAVKLFDAEEMILTNEEKQLIEGTTVDGEFVSPWARDRATVGLATAELNRDIAVFERTAEKSYVAGRLLPTRELYQMILEQNPGHTHTLCKLGLVHLRLDDAPAASDTFRRAVELDPNNPYAFRMLGFSLMQIGDLPAAEQAVKRAVDLAPNEVLSHMLLAKVSYRLGRIEDAISHFKGAISADPLPSEPYYNIALLLARLGKKEEARTYYQQALERGAVPDPDLEDTLDKP